MEQGGLGHFIPQLATRPCASLRLRFLQRVQTMVRAVRLPMVRVPLENMTGDASKESRVE